ncbi:MAG: alkaline phosphatase family protein [Pleurocapsa sp. SU_196_0]|nr:alkaline phosphatase family protein [Pleurocapsa sp. SU_196_0]
MVLFIVDGLGQWQLEKHIADGDVPNLKALMEGAHHQVITSVFPSTTMAAVTAMHTATPPAKSGWLGYTLWLPEVGATVEMIGQINQTTHKPLEDRGFLASVPGMYTRLEKLGVQVSSVQPSGYRGSWLNDWYWQGAVQYGYITANILPSATARPLELDGRKLVVLYWADYDSVCHRHGPSSSAASDEISALDHALGRFMARAPEGRQDGSRGNGRSRTDRPESGRGGVSRARRVVALEVAERPGGDRVCRTLRVAPDAVDAVEEHVRRYGDVMRSSEAWEAGLFGGAPGQVLFRERVGDLIVMPRDGRQLCWTFTGKQPSRPHLGSHGALSHEEMRVPLLAARL